MTNLPVLVAGGGIGGLSVALTLQQIGVPCLVLEAVAELKPFGVGINLQPNAVRELYASGPTDWMRSGETLWVLHKSYRAKREEVVRIAQELLDHPRYRIEASDDLGQALEVFSTNKVDFADAVALADARRAGVTLHTFDRGLAKLAGATVAA